MYMIGHETTDEACTWESQIEDEDDWNEEK